jgi:transposase-like protein
MRHRPRGKTVLRCPQCRSVHVVYDAALITGQRYHCLDCDYLGSFVLEEDLPRTADEPPR